MGNKIDRSEERKISTEQGKQLALNYNFIYKETSAIENSKVFDSFRILIEMTNYSAIERAKFDKDSIILNHRYNTQNKKKTCYK